MRGIMTTDTARSYRQKFRTLAAVFLLGASPENLIQKKMYFLWSPNPIFQVVIDASNSVVVETGPKTSLGCDFSN